MAKQRLLFIEQRPEDGESGPAWIGRATLSKSGRTVYFNGKALKRLEGRRMNPSHRCLETGEAYWVANPAEDGADRQGPPGDPVGIQVEALEEYLALRGLAELDATLHRTVSDLRETDIPALQQLEHKLAESKPGPADAATRRKRRARARRSEST